jgi:hypothetical protein
VIEVTPPVKRPRGRPKGSKSKKPVVRRDQVTIAMQAMKKRGEVTNSFLRELNKLTLETEKLAVCLNEYNRVMEQRDAYKKNLTRAIKKMSNQKPLDYAGKVNLNAYIPVDLMREFSDVIDESPLNRSEIISNLILNYIKAHKGFSKAELKGISDGVHKLEKQSYRNTKVAAEMLVHAPYDAVRHHNPYALKQSALVNTSHDAVYAKRVDEQYTEKEVVRAIAKGTGVDAEDVDMSDLFGEVDR